MFLLFLRSASDFYSIASSIVLRKKEEYSCVIKLIDTDT